MKSSKKLTLSKFIDNLQQQGRYNFTKEEALEAIGCSKVALTIAVGRLIKKKRLFMPKKRFLVIVPTEYQVSGMLPASWYVDELMKFENMSYYVCLLSAASLHGASHQQPQEFQVMIPKQLRPIKLKGSIIHFYTKNKFSSQLIEQIKTYTGYMNVSSPALTAIDLVRYPHASGYFNNIATVLMELNEKIKKKDLQIALEQYADIPSAQRLGYLFDVINNHALSDVVESWVKLRKVRTIPLIVGKVYTKNQLNSRWNVYINEQVDIDI